MTPNSRSTHDPDRNPDPKAIDLARLGRYFDGTASAEEQVVVDAWIGDDPAGERRAAVEALRAAWTDDARRLTAPYDTDTAWARLAAVLDGDATERRLPAIGAALARRTRRPHVAWAAAILVVAGAATSAWWFSRRAEVPQPIAQAPAMREYVTPRGRRAAFRLLDGSEITLNADSRLRVPTDFGAARRDVYLEGEAYFNVVHDDARPFVVHTAQSAVRDIGTRFGVRAYADAGAERVAVAEGAVEVTNGSAPGSAAAPLRAGQVAAVARGRVQLVRGANVADELAWTDGRLVFASMPFGEAARRLGRWYDLEIQIKDPALAKRPVSGSYSNEPIAEVLTLITSAVGARYELRGRLVTISTAGAAQ